MANLRTDFESKFGDTRVKMYTEHLYAMWDALASLERQSESGYPITSAEILSSSNKRYDISSFLEGLATQYDEEDHTFSDNNARQKEQDAYEFLYEGFIQALENYRTNVENKSNPELISTLNSTLSETDIQQAQSNLGSELTKFQLTTEEQNSQISYNQTEDYMHPFIFTIDKPFDDKSPNSNIRSGVEKFSYEEIIDIEKFARKLGHTSSSTLSANERQQFADAKQVASDMLEFVKLDEVFRRSVKLGKILPEGGVVVFADPNGDPVEVLTSDRQVIDSAGYYDPAAQLVYIQNSGGRLRNHEIMTEEVHHLADDIIAKDYQSDRNLSQAREDSTFNVIRVVDKTDQLKIVTDHDSDASVELPVETFAKKIEHEWLLTGYASGANEVNNSDEAKNRSGDTERDAKLEALIFLRHEEIAKSNSSYIPNRTATKIEDCIVLAEVAEILPNYIDKLLALRTEKYQNLEIEPVVATVAPPIVEPPVFNPPPYSSLPPKDWSENSADNLRRLNDVLFNKDRNASGARIRDDVEALKIIFSEAGMDAEKEIADLAKQDAKYGRTADLDGSNSLLTTKVASEAMQTLASELQKANADNFISSDEDTNAYRAAVDVIKNSKTSDGRPAFRQSTSMVDDVGDLKAGEVRNARDLATKVADQLDL